MTPIWEGTTNILSLDVLRALSKSQGRVLEAFSSRIQKVLDGPSRSELGGSLERLKESRDALLAFAGNPSVMEYLARDFAFGLARTLAGALLLEHAAWSGASVSDVAAAVRWMAMRDLLPETIVSARKELVDSSAQLDESLVFDGYDPKNLLSRMF